MFPVPGDAFKFKGSGKNKDGGENRNRTLNRHWFAGREY